MKFANGTSSKSDFVSPCVLLVLPCVNLLFELDCIGHVRRSGVGQARPETLSCAEHNTTPFEFTSLLYMKIMKITLLAQNIPSAGTTTLSSHRYNQNTRLF